MKKIVIIGGGNGTSVLLASLKGNEDYELTAIVSMADDGGSTGRLRQSYNSSAVGDIRQCLVALCSDEQTKMVLSYRFGKGDLSGHSFGNLLLAAGEISEESIVNSIDFARHALGIKHKIIPATLDKPNLIYKTGQTEIVGVYKIAQTKIVDKPNLFLEPKARLYNEARKAIEQADLIIIAPGNFYCSIIPALLVEEISEEIMRSPAKTVFICNLVNTQQTNGFTPSGYIEELNRLVGRELIDCTIYNSNTNINTKILRSSESIILPSNYGIEDKMIGTALIDPNVVEPDSNDAVAGIRSKIRHDKVELAKQIGKLFEEKS